jgi:hypothetical protein
MPRDGSTKNLISAVKANKASFHNGGESLNASPFKGAY